MIFVFFFPLQFRVTVMEIKMFISCYYLKLNGFIDEIVSLQLLEAIPSVDVLNTTNMNSIPPTSVLKQLAVAIE